jgi:hypothetical protein
VTDHPILRVLHRTLDVFERADVACAVMGGFAVRHWALPRPTYDVDFAVAVDGDELVRLMRTFDEAGFSVPSHFLTGFTDRLAGMRKVGIGCFDSGSVWNVDLFLATTPFVRSAFERRVPSDVEGRSMSVVSVEDLLLFKLLANRAKDRADIEDLLLVSGALDLAYLRRWAAHLEVSERLEDALRESGRND